MSHRSRLEALARRAMQDHGMEPDFPAAALAELDRLSDDDGPVTRDLRHLPWTSLDNEESRDLDQLEVCDELDDGVVRLRVAIADVDALVKRGLALDDHARHNTTSVYTAASIFPMLPPALSTGRTSLNHGEDRDAVVVEMEVNDGGAVRRADVYLATVHNHCKLGYDTVTAWLNGGADAPEALAASPALAAQLRLQDELASRLRTRRQEQGALDFDRSETEPVLEGDEVTTLRDVRPDRARDIIEDFMIAANSATASFLAARGRPALRRVVRTPARWPRIVSLARDAGDTLPPEPDIRALEAFLRRRRAAEPETFPDLSLSVIKLLGSGEYAVADPSRPPEGHFALAVSRYTHSTAPNRRFPDLVIQRLLKSVLAGARPAYDLDELRSLARHCTRQEDAANKVERQVRKAAAAMIYASRIGDRFDGIVTGASAKGTWVRTTRPRIEGKLVKGASGLDVGDRVQVRLIDTDPERGFIDFARA